MQDYTLPPAPPPPPRRGPSPQFPWLVLLLLVLLAAWLLPSYVEQWNYSATRGRERAEVESARAELHDNNLESISRAFANIAKAISPSVVHIDTLQRIAGPHDEWSHVFGEAREYEARGQGSGVILDPQGFIVTNNHVVAGAQQISVKLSDGRGMTANLVGADPATDLAVLKIDADGLIAAEWGDSTALPVGSMVWAIGNPYGLDRSITFGIISAKGRQGVGDTPVQDSLQIDAAINPGNSGGPLVDVNARVVGINSTIVGPTNQGIGFAIPSELARSIYDQLKSGGGVARGWLGVALPRHELTAEMAGKLGLKDPRGALVLAVEPNSPADKAGFEKGDVIVEWNKQPVENPNALRMFVARTPIDARVPVGIIRKGESQTLSVTVEKRPDGK